MLGGYGIAGAIPPLEHTGASRRAWGASWGPCTPSRRAWPCALTLGAPGGARIVPCASVVPAYTDRCRPSCAPGLGTLWRSGDRSYHGPLGDVAIRDPPARLAGYVTPSQRAPGALPKGFRVLSPLPVHLSLYFCPLVVKACFTPACLGSHASYGTRWGPWSLPRVFHIAFGFI